MEDVKDLICIRRTEHVDVVKIKELIRKDTKQAFGKINLFKILERSSLSLTLTRNKNDIVGCACFYNHPDVKYAHPENWQQWFDEEIAIPNVNSVNSVFLHFVVLELGYQNNLMLELVKTVFIVLAEAQNIFLITEGGSELKCATTSPFERVQVKSNLNVSVAYRHNVFPVLFSRMATVEDNDDLVPLFNDQTELLRKTYGRYYVAELVEAQSDDLKCVVVESERRAVGFISATKKVDLDGMNEVYDLDIFHGLHKPHPDDSIAGRFNPEALVLTAPDTNEAQGESYLWQEEQVSVVTDTETSKATSDIPEPIDEAPWTRRRLIATLNAHKTNISSPPVYRGQPDVVAIQLYAIRPQFESRFIDMLPLLFDQFPDINYAAISVPRMVPVFPLLRHFVHCRIRPGKDPEQELYVFHRAGLLRDFKVRRTRHEDKDQIELLTNRMYPKDRSLLLKDLEKYITHGRDKDGTQITSFVAEAAGKIVGIAIMRDEQSIEWIRAHYDIEDHIYFNHHARNEHATLYHFLLSANFSCRRPTFLRELLRQSNKTCLYYPLLAPFAKTCSYSKATFISCLSNFYAIRPRRQIIYPPKEVMGDKGPQDRVVQRRDDAPALFMGTSRLFTEPRVIINARVIVVGASTTGLAVLETMAMCTYIRFTNLVLLSPNGIPGDILRTPDTVACGFLTTDHAYPLSRLSMLALRNCVSVVYGKLTAIDRKFKKITINHKRQLSYDYLVITTGLQYHACCPSGEDAEPQKKTKTDRRLSVDYPGANPPENLFLVNNIEDAEDIRKWVRSVYLPSLAPEELNIPDWKKAQLSKKKFAKISKPTKVGEEDRLSTTSLFDTATASGNQVVIYGYSLDAYTCITGLLNAGVPGKNIIMIQPPRAPEERPAFENPEVEEMTSEQLRSMEVKIGTDFTLFQWNETSAPDVGRIDEVTFTSKYPALKIPCKAFFCFHKKTVDYDLFNAVNNACLVFDARVVVDINFHTNDPAIRAAGPVTKLQRIYYNDQWRHELANSQEIGTMLGQQMLDLFSPFEEVPARPQADEFHLLPEFERPKILGCVLPGDYHYLTVSKPALYEPLEKRKERADFGRILETGYAKEGNGYFYIHLNKYNMVETVTCLSKKPFPASNYIQLYGVHEMLLNKLASRFDEGLIHDLYEFLDDVWPLAIYHDRFADFREEVREILLTCPPNAKEAIARTVRDMLADTGEIRNSELEELKKLYVEDGYKEAVERRILKFIDFNYDLLPMYAKPDLV
ncbi:unnamed protein product [Calicophoron daubneyi]|uniref:Cilia- and flagella-associated protein 61 N-terminal domain-containing protein n=1 Tax=Calicophoron daubneyi TaxID=300641 RepID=A0AAV2T265_CALDB